MGEVSVIYWAYLATEYIGIHKKIRCLIIFNCVIRVILIVLLALATIILFVKFGFFSRYTSYGLIYIVPGMAYLIFRTWLQLEILKAVKELYECSGTVFTLSEQPCV